MKKMMILIFALMSFGCSYSSVDGGEEGVLIYQPYIFGHGGVDSEPVKTGAIWTSWSTGVERYNIKPVKYTEAFIDLTASDNVAIDFSAYVTLQIDKGNSPKVHEFSGVKWYENKVQDVFRTIVRNEGRRRSSIELRTNPEVIEKSQENIIKAIRSHLKNIDLPVTVSKVIIGKVVPPNEVLKEAERTAAQKQREKTQTARASAELLRKQAETNMALADKAYSDEFSMTTDQFLRNKELDIMGKAVESGDVSLIMNASNAEPMIQVR